MSGTMIRRALSGILALAVVAAALTVLISAQEEDPSKPFAIINSGPVFVKAGYAGRLAVFNRNPSRSVRVNLSFFDAFSGEKLGESGVHEVAAHTGVSYELPFTAQGEILGAVQVQPVDSTAEPSDVSFRQQRGPRASRSDDDSDRRRPRRRGSLAASIQVFDDQGQGYVYDALNR